MSLLSLFQSMEDWQLERRVNSFIVTVFVEGSSNVGSG